MARHNQIRNDRRRWELNPDLSITSLNPQPLDHSWLLPLSYWKQANDTRLPLKIASLGIKSCSYLHMKYGAVFPEALLAHTEK